jgi:putative tricarboxylic transport membrane protein
MFKKNDWIFGLISILIGVFVLANIRDLLKVSNSMDPAGPAALPSIIAWAMVAIGLVIRREKGKGKTETLPRRERKSLTPVVLITLASAVFIACLSSVGYPIAMPLLIAAIMLSVGVRDVKKIAITSIVTTLILFVSFSFGLNVDLPLGILKRFF